MQLGHAREARTTLLFLGYLTVLAAGISASDGSRNASEPHGAPKPYAMDMAWYDAWLAEQPVTASVHSRRSLTGSSSSFCNIHMVGTGRQAGVSSIRISCTSSGRGRSRNGRVQIQVGYPIYRYYLSNRRNFKGVDLSSPSSPFSSETVLFFTNVGKLTVTGSVTNMVVNQWATMHVEAGSDVTFNRFTFSRNVGQRFPTVAGARSSITVQYSTFGDNVCIGSGCHTAGVYVTEGESLVLKNSRFFRNKSNLAGALMITSGAYAIVQGNTFRDNSTPNYGQFGGAILNDWCRDPRAKRRTQIVGNSFINNWSNGSGGAIQLGTAEGGGCPQTIITGNTFSGNKAKSDGGAIYSTYCNGQSSSFKNNRFSSNGCHVGLNAGQCPTPNLAGSTFSKPSKALCASKYFP